MPLQIEKIQESAARKARRWSFTEEYLDTEVIRGIEYGNLLLRKQSHLYLTHGVIVSFVLLCLFWGMSANWERLTAWTGVLWPVDDKKEYIYTAVTTVTQLPPPPLIEQPKPAAPKPAPAKVEKPPNVGKVKKVKKEEAPPDQTLATQKEIRKAVQQGVGDGTGDGPVFIPVEKMPRFIRQRKPRYPETARRAGIEGRVFVGVLISESGKPVRAQVMKREPADETVFDKSAINAVMKSTYSPGFQSGKAVKVWLMIPIRFTLR